MNTKRFLAIVLVLCFCLYANSVFASPKYGVYGLVSIVDVSDSTQAEKDMVEENARRNNSQSKCTIIYDSTIQEYTVNSSVLWSGNYSKEDFVNVVLNYQPEGSYYGTSGWRTFYQNYAHEWYETCTFYGMDPVFMICVSAWQTGFGTSTPVCETGDLFGIRDLREYGYSDIPARSQEILKRACKRYSDYTTCTTTISAIRRGFGAWIASEDPEFPYGVARLMNKLFSSLNVITNIKIVGDFRQLKCLPTYNSIQ